jgi:hypothetical protein
MYYQEANRIGVANTINKELFPRLPLRDKRFMEDLLFTFFQEKLYRTGRL